MAKYMVYGAEVTSSRYGKGVYEYKDIIEAESETEAKATYKEKHKAPQGKRWQVRIKKVEKIIN